MCNKSLQVSLLLLVLVFVSCRTHRQHAASVQAFMEVSVTGAIQMDDKGQEIAPYRDTQLIVYVLSKKQLRFESGWYNGAGYEVLATELPTGVHDIGVLERSGEVVRYQVAAGKKGYRLLMRKSEKIKAEPARQIVTGRCAVRYCIGGRCFWVDAAFPMQLQQSPGY